MSSFCLGCGSSMVEGERFCGVCGRDSEAGTSVPRIDPGVAFGLAPETSGKAIFSLIASFFIIILPFSIVAVVFGHLALSEIRKSGGRLTGKGLAIAGIVLGYLGTAFFLALLGIGIWVDRTRSTRRSGLASGETSVIATVRTLNTAEIAYRQAHREEGYTCSLQDLSSAWGINADVVRGRKNGYVFQLQGCQDEVPVVKYQVVAYPSVSARKGSPAYCSDQTSIIRMARNGSAEDCLTSGVELTENQIRNPEPWPKN